MHTKKYELYCGWCGKVFGYTDRLFEKREVLTADDIQYPDGSQAKTGDKIECDCVISFVQIRENKCLS